MTPEARARWKRRVRTFALVALIVVGLPAAAHYYLRWSADWELRSALAEADRLDPGWRLEELEGSREAVTDPENAALKVLAIRKAMPAGWPNNPRSLPVTHRVMRDFDPEVGAHEARIRALSPEIQFSPEMIQLMRDDLRKMAPVLADALALAEFPHGRYPLEFARSIRDTTTLSNEGQIVAKLLWVDGMVAAQDQQIDRALTSAVAILNIGHSIGDEPLLISQSQRLGIQRLALVTIERALAQGQASPKSLEAMQRLLEDEAAQPLLLQAFRAERAGTYHHMKAVLSGEWKYSLRFFQGRIANKLPLRWNRYIDMVIVRRTYPEYFRLLTALVEIAKLPPEKQLPQIQLLDGPAGQMPKEFESWFQATARSALTFLRNQAWLRCAITALAAERFRSAHGSWPDSLSALAPEFLARMSIDPFDGQPLRYVRLKDSVVIYSIGPDGADDGGLVNRLDFQPAKSDVGFQLWDVSHRRQPSPPPPPTKPVTQADEEPAP
jgi:hypothetical protein